MGFPNIIIVGVAKCGTKALWYNLDKHPDICMGVRSDYSIEINFWKDKFWYKGLDWYLSHFEEGKIGGEKSIHYHNNLSSLKTIKRYIPDVKIIMCVRNPVDRAYSHYQMDNRGRNTPFDYKPYFNRGKYIESLRDKVLSVFDKENVHITVAEYMKKDPTKEMGKVFDFIGVSDLAFPKKIISGKLIQDKSNRPQDIEYSRYEQFYRVWSTYKGRLQGEQRRQLIELYRPYNEQLFDYLGYEIKEWGE